MRRRLGLGADREPSTASTEVVADGAADDEPAATEPMDTDVPVTDGNDTVDADGALSLRRDRR